MNASRLSAERAGFQEGDCWTNPIPLFHTGGGLLAGIGCIARRGKHAVVPQFDPALVLELIEAERGSRVLTVPTILIALLDHPSLPTRDLSTLRTVMSGGANVAADGAAHEGDARLRFLDPVRASRTARHGHPDPPDRQ